jgi:hypothetical protein
MYTLAHLVALQTFYCNPALEKREPSYLNNSHMKYIEYYN